MPGMGVLNGNPGGQAVVKPILVAPDLTQALAAFRSPHRSWAAWSGQGRLLEDRPVVVKIAVDALKGIE